MEKNTEKNEEVVEYYIGDVSGKPVQMKKGEAPNFKELSYNKIVLPTGYKLVKEGEEPKPKYTLERLVDDVWNSINNYHKDNGLLVKSLEVVERKTPRGGKRLRVRFVDSFAEKHVTPKNKSIIKLSFD